MASQARYSRRSSGGLDRVIPPLASPRWRGPGRCGAGCAQPLIKNWEEGRRQPKDPYRLLYRRVFDLVNKAARRSPAQVLAEIMPEGDPLSRLPARVGRRVGMGTVQDLSMRVHGLRLAGADEPEEAAHTASRMLDMSADLTSDRTTQRACVVLVRLNL